MGAGTGALALQTLVYMKRPKLTAAFSVATIALDRGAGRIEGEDLNRLARFLRVSGGPAQFDLEYDGRVFVECRLKNDPAAESISFSYESLAISEGTREDPSTTSS